MSMFVKFYYVFIFILELYIIEVLVEEIMIGLEMIQGFLVRKMNY